MTDPGDIDRAIADLYERLAVLHRQRADAARIRPRKQPVVEVETKPSEDVIDEMRRNLRKRGVPA